MNSSSADLRRARRAVIVFHQGRETEASRKGLLRHVSWRRAALLLRSNLDHTLRTAASVPAADVILYYRDAPPRDLPSDLAAFPQSGGDLGEAIADAFAAAVADGYHEIAVVGTDSPNLSSMDLEAAFAKLSHAECVIGPSRDGGFFLIAVREASLRTVERAMAEMRWHNSRVLATLASRLTAARARVAYIRALKDVDRWTDVAACDPETAWAALDASRIRALIATPGRAVITEIETVRARIKTLFTLHSCLPAPPPAVRLHRH